MCRIYTTFLSQSFCVRYKCRFLLRFITPFLHHHSLRPSLPYSHPHIYLAILSFLPALPLFLSVPCMWRIISLFPRCISIVLDADALWLVANDFTVVYGYKRLFIVVLHFSFFCFTVWLCFHLSRIQFFCFISVFCIHSNYYYKMFNHSHSIIINILAIILFYALVYNATS